MCLERVDDCKTLGLHWFISHYYLELGACRDLHILKMLLILLLSQGNAGRAVLTLVACNTFFNGATTLFALRRCCVDGCRPTDADYRCSCGDCRLLCGFAVFEILTGLRLTPVLG